MANVEGNVQFGQNQRDNGWSHGGRPFIGTDGNTSSRPEAAG